MLLLPRIPCGGDGTRLLRLEEPEVEGGIVSIAAAPPTVQSIWCVVAGDGAQSYTTDASSKEYSSAVFDDYSALRAWWAQTCGMQGQEKYDPLAHSPTLRPMSLSSVPPLQRMCGISCIQKCVTTTRRCPASWWISGKTREPSLLPVAPQGAEQTHPVCYEEGSTWWQDSTQLGTPPASN